MTDKDNPDVWVGIKKCGCVVAVVVDVPGMEKDTEKCKIEFLRDGLSVVRGTWAEWKEKYLPAMQFDCTHEPKAEKQAELAL